MTTATPSARRWWILAVIGIAQLMVVLDNSIVNIALPSAQADLGFSDAERQWVVTAYALAFGSLLLLGGRLSDRFGRKTAFVTGLVGFGAVSVLGGLAPNFDLLVAARALQGVFGALLAPAALSLLSTTFPGGRDRATAFGVFSGLAASGAATGLLLGGVLTEYADWRWCLYVNAAFATVALAGVLALLPAHPPGARPRLDPVGTVTASLGLFGLVFGFATAETNGWGSPAVYAFLVAGVLVLGVFVLVQRRVAAPLLPLRVLLHRHRGGAYLTIFVLMTGMFATGLFLAYVLQQVLGYSPVLTGVAFLPQVAGVALASNTVPRWLLPRVGARPLLALGVLVLGAGLLWFSFLTPTSTYVADVLGPFTLLGIGLGTALSTAFNTATLDVEPQDAGVASAMASTMQQVGGSVGTALLSSIAGTASAIYATRDGLAPPAAAVAGYDVAFLVAAIVFAAGAVVIGILVPRVRAHHAHQPSAAALDTSTYDTATLDTATVDTATVDTATVDTATVDDAADAPAVTGRVIGIPGRSATLTLVDPTDGHQADRAVTDDDGRFRLVGRHAGSHLLVVTARGSRPVAEHVVLGGTVREHDTRVEPVSGDELVDAVHFTGRV